MPSFSSCIAVILLTTSVTFAIPAPVDTHHLRQGLRALGKRAVSQEVFDDLNFYEQYAAAGYCEANNNSTGSKVTCESGNCPLVEADDTETLLEFQK